ncbi:AraC family transcriptional regulator [Roseibium aquae]|uniref:AraC family transcriptional regulator n=1 Tax=Roseibium aquae TaxID=1323746 RepID=A0A916TG89_9HYPH|nr:AraC family transcriptional regulator [Roseibium aquae]GGB41369.1 AraC family transcriptional regulator [Roseibium aquae]
MIALPIPLFTAAVLLFLAMRAAFIGETPRMVLALVMLCAGQSVLIVLNQHYGIQVLAPLQPVTAGLIPVAAYLTFLITAQRPLHPWPDCLHLVPILAIALAAATMSSLLDWLLFLVFCGYAGLIWIRIKGPAADLPMIRIENSDKAVLLWRFVAFALIGSALGDLGIGYAVMAGHGDLKPVIVSAYSGLFLLVIGGLSMSETLNRPLADQDQTPEGGGKTAPKPVEPQVAAALLQRLDSYMRESQSYLNPDLTLRKLARQLGVPEKQLSAAVNEATGENLPRYVNRFRIDTACRLMAEGAPVTSAIYASGFNTKSNFNREFLRVKGQSPSAWLAAHGST